MELAKQPVVIIIAIVAFALVLLTVSGYTRSVANSTRRDASDQKRASIDAATPSTLARNQTVTNQKDLIRTTANNGVSLPKTLSSADDLFMDSGDSRGSSEGGRGNQANGNSQENIDRTPKELRMMRGRSFNGDLRDLPHTPPVKKERPEREPPERILGTLQPTAGGLKPVLTPTSPSVGTISPAAPAPGTIANFDGLDFATWGAGHPPDTNGDVGPNHYIQTVNTSIGIFNKSTGALITGITFDNFMSAGNFGNLCDTDNFGDPVVVYDTFEDRWIISDFAFQLDGSNNVINPPGAFQCFAVSKSGDPVGGGWNYYSINTTGGLGDYPKFGIWPDGLYMSVNMFDYAAAGSFQNVRLYAFNKAQMYAGYPTIQVVSFDAPSSEFTLLPSNARLQAGTPPAGTPNYLSTVDFFNALTVWKFHVDWTSISLSTFTGPFNSITATSWVQMTGAATVPEPNPGNDLDTLHPRLMMQNQYTNIGGIESLWNSHTVAAASTTTSKVRYYQVKVTGGTVEASATQAGDWGPDATNRFMPSVAVDGAGNMAIGYSASSGSVKPALRYAGRLSADPVNTLSLTETSLFEGTGVQTGSCGGPCTRWGDYSAMSLDPDGCTFWYTNEYYVVNGLDDHTRIGSFKFSPCTTVTTGTVSGIVTATVGSAPISFATVALGSRTTSTDGSGFYSFTGIPSGTYPIETASANGYNSSTVNNIVVTDGGTTTQNFSLSTAAASACLTDTTMADFQTGVPTNVDLTTSSGNVTLLQPVSLDQQQTTNGGSGHGFTSTSFQGQTFTPGVSGTLPKLDVFVFCASCSGTDPDITIEVRSTSGGNPVMTAGGLLASATVAGTSSGSGLYLSPTFSISPSLTAGTVYGFVVRLVSNRTTGTQATLESSGDAYAGGRRKVCTTASCSNATGQSNDLVFRTYMNTGFAPSGDQISSLKDANPDVHSIANWTTLSWTNLALPSGTTLKFQVAGSLVPSGPFNFVGPDGTAATFFTTSGASLSQFNGLRYLKYKAFLSTTNSAVTPTLNDVTVCFTTVANPTAVELTRFSAASFSDGVQLNWGSGFEVNNLGYHLYREQNGKRTRVTPAVVAGSALTVGPGSRLTAGYSYSWFDPKGAADTAYYLEAIDLSGGRQWTGPIYPYAGSSRFVSPRRQRAMLLNEIAGAGAAAGAGQRAEQSWPAAMKDGTSPTNLSLSNPSLSNTTLGVQQGIAAGRAVKIQVRQTGWYRLAQAELVAAGLDPSSDARFLQLYVDGEEVPIELSSSGPRFNANDTLEFYGVALDTPTTDTRTYWLINGSSAGKRITVKRGKSKSSDQDFAIESGVRSFNYTTERREKLLYFANLLNGDAENIFGAPVLSEPVNQTLVVRNLDREAAAHPQLEVALQGLTAGVHQVQVQVNGTDAGTLTFAGREHPVQKFEINRSLLREGDNTVSLVATGGDSDISLIDWVRLTYAHQYKADNNALRFSVPGGQTVRVTGFSSPNIRVIDVTNPSSPLEVATTAGPLSGEYAVTITAPGSDAKTMMAFTDDLVGHPASVFANQPSSWNAGTNAADMIIITHKDFRQAIGPLASLRRGQGMKVAVVDVEDVYDEFSYGAHTPVAIKSFLMSAASNWSRKPQYLLLVGDSSWDPRNYLDQGENDFVPTKLIDTAYMETGSDDWLADFNDAGLPSMAIGRLPGRTAAEVNLMVSKILSYEQERESNVPLRGAVMVADSGFESKSTQTQVLLPASVVVETINRTDVGNDDVMRGQIVDALNQGPMIVNYYGHGSVSVWTGAGLLDSQLAANLTNINRPSLYVMMTCLNGYAHDAYVDSLGESALKAQNGGAVAVWASSGFTEAEPQFVMDLEFYRLLFGSQPLRLGDATRNAKAVITDLDVRRTWTLLGDPAMRMR